MRIEKEVESKQRLMKTINLHWCETIVTSSSVPPVTIQLTPAEHFHE